ncbi:RNA-binding S4 domain-containing protein [Corynebacterium liangguodongii]|uniref:RNA-binding protein S4 n=1 Tax=Corynebacterium liangguodongii TaxID=2079535 RepID=A0A2S0WEY0_9CORY|nr:RNA-binding S4 domain-containing protein [Corynebacterium liangguodongii]AWB84328.1 RNA-binding protein S4 [Corynebacterium liangguodongii]PWB99818.1 RNA-binding S4 domain-containing protein [Corynebacterium liangguodongii]
MSTEPDGSPVRLDVWLWAARIFKTRSQSAEAVRAGHVKVGGAPAKPAAQVVPGDRLRVWKDHRYLDLEVTGTAKKRVGAPVARTLYIDHSPPPPPRELFAAAPVRDRGAGRPTKKDRRAIDRLRGF